MAGPTRPRQIDPITCRRRRPRPTAQIASDPGIPMGLKALTRELHADERPQLLAHLLALGGEDRRLRFAHALSDDGVRHYVENKR